MLPSSALNGKFPPVFTSLTSAMDISILAKGIHAARYCNPKVKKVEMDIEMKEVETVRDEIKEEFVEI